MKSPTEQVAIMRKPVLPEDEGRHFLITVTAREAAEKWIAAQAAEYFKPGDYYISVAEL